MADINVIVLPDGTEYPVSDYYLPVAISNPTNGQVLKYDATNQVWYNGEDTSGSSILYGTSAPTSQLGTDGCLYVKYTEGTGGASDTVDALYVKLDGDWCQISTGGGGGTSDYNDLTNKPQINSVELSGNKSLDDLGIQPSEISKTASGSIATFTDGGDDIPVSEYECEIVAQQASGTPTPVNPLPITGFSQADILQYDENLFNSMVTSSHDGITTSYNPTTGLISIQNNTRTTNYSYGSQRAAVATDLDATHTYRYVMYPSVTGVVLSNTNSVILTDTFTGETEVWLRVTSQYDFVNAHPIGDIMTVRLFIFDMTVGYDTTYLVDFGQTIYGGKLIYANGKWFVRATQKYFSYTEVLYYGTYGSDNANLYYMDIPNYNTEKIKQISNATHVGVLLSNMLSKITSDYSDMHDNEIRTQGNLAPQYFYFRADSFASLTDLNTFLANSPLQVVAELETPVIIPLASSAKIKTLSGVNNIFSNTGDSTLKYFTNDADGIEELIKANGISAERGYREVTLWTGPETPTVSGTDITLSDSIYNYDEIVFSIYSQDNETAQENFRVSDLTIGSLYIQLAYHSNYFGVYWAFTSDTSITIKRISSTGQTAIKYLKITGIKYSEIVAGSTYHKYSTEEKIVGEWIDGKTIYERTYTFTAPSSNTFTREDLGIPMSGISDAWIDVQNSFAKTSGMCTNVAFYDGNSTKPDQFGGYLNFLQTNLAFDYRVGSDLYSSNIVLTIRYTKSS